MPVRPYLRTPSAELYNTSHAYLRQKGYQVAQLDFRPDQRALQYNPLAYVTNATQAQQIADILIHTAYPHPAKDPFWQDSAKALLGLLIELLIADKDHPKTLFQLCQWLYAIAAEPTCLNRKVLSLLPPATQQRYRAFWAQEPKLTASVLSTCQTALHKVAADPNIQWLTKTDTLRTHLLRSRPTALFIIVAEKDLPYFRFLLSLLFIQLFDSCLSAPIKGRPYLPVYFFLDEFGQLSLPRDRFVSYINLLRKYQVSVSVIIQEIAQLRALYGSAATESIVYGGLSNHLLFPGLSPDTTATLEKVMGRTLVNGKVQPLLAQDAIRTLPKNRALLIAANKRPVLLRTRPWYRSWRLRKRGKLR